MITHLINRKGSPTDPDNLIDRLDVLPTNDLNAIFDELKNMFFNMPDENPKEKDHHAALATPKKQIDKFIKHCKDYYGKARIKASTPVDFINQTYQGYIPLIRYSLENPLAAFSTRLYDYFNEKLAPQVASSESSCSSSSSSSSSSASSSSAFDSSPTFIRSNVRRTTREDDEDELGASETKRQRTAEDSVPQCSNDDACLIGTSTRRDTSERDEPAEGTRATKRARQ